VFFREYWESAPLVIRRNTHCHFDALLSLQDIDIALTTLDLRYPDVAVANAEVEIARSEFTFGGDKIDVAGLYQLFFHGTTIILSRLHRKLPSLALLCSTLSKQFSAPFQANIYLTPPNAKGFKPHYDTHDVFVLQIAGAKHWHIYGKPVNLPLPSQDYDSAIHSCGSITEEFDLEAGDTAYIPRGIMHDATSGDQLSL